MFTKNEVKTLSALINSGHCNFINKGIHKSFDVKVERIRKKLAKMGLYTDD